MLLSGAVVGTVARKMRLPALTGYMTAGILLAQVPAILPLKVMPEYQQHFELLSGPVNDFAMALVLFVLGGHFQMARFRPIARSLLTLGGIEAILTFLLVCGLTLPFLDRWDGAVLLGTMAIAVAPATTLLVLKEYGAKGRFSETITLLTAFSNVVAIFLFEIVLLVLAAKGGEHGDSVSAIPVLWDMFGSLLFGFLAGHALILMQERLGNQNYSLTLTTTVLLTIGVCHLAHVPHMLTFLVTGAVVTNRSRFFEPVSATMDAFAQPAYVAFFVLSGWHLQFDVFLENSWIIAIYVLARTAGKIFGMRLGLKFSGPALRTRDGELGLGLLCQAGAAIALAGVIKDRYSPELSAQLLSIILGGVAIFELAGPILVGRAAVAAGEVPMSRLLVRQDHEGETAHWARALLRTFRGRRPSRSDLEEMKVGQIMRRGPAALPAKAGLDEILRFANHSPFNLLPVVREDGALVGLIELHDLEEFAYDPTVASLVIAADVTGLSPEQGAMPAQASLQQAATFFQGFRSNTAAVIDPEAGNRFVGMVERSEVLDLRRLQGNLTPEETAGGNFG